MVRLSNIKLRISQASDQNEERQALKSIILSKMGIDEQELIDFIIFKKSIDARKKAIFIMFIQLMQK